ncbi:MAG: class I SAM-dependent methyltransferase [Pirellulaceae bacterium]
MPAYELIDFGDGRKLERLGGLLVDRPCPAAEEAIPESEWPQADARFELRDRHTGTWRFLRPAPDPWLFRTWFGVLELFPTDFGHLGVFPEQRSSWQWLRQQTNDLLSGLRILNLFAYTGGSTLAAAAAGCEVTHVDSAKNIVARARSNSEQSHLQDRPVRWIVDDALKFVQREVRRGRKYDGVILDPPSYGHGVKSRETWKIDRDLPVLLESLQQLLTPCRLFLFTCHSPGFSGPVMREHVARFLDVPAVCETGTLNLKTGSGRVMSGGHFLRWFDKLDS